MNCALILNYMYKIHSTATVSDPGETKKIYNQNQPLDLPAAVLAVEGLLVDAGVDGRLQSLQWKPLLDFFLACLQVDAGVDAGVVGSRDLQRHLDEC